MQENIQSINIHQLLEKCKSKKEIYRFLSHDCKAYFPKIGATNIYFFKQKMQGQKDYLKRDEVKLSSSPHIEGLTVQDFLEYAREKNQLLKYLPDERDWVHMDRTWISNIIFTLDTENFQNKIEQAIAQRQQILNEQQNLTIQLRIEFVQALGECQQFSNDKGRSVYIIKDSSKRKRRRDEIEEVKNEELKLKEDKQEYLREHKRLKQENDSLNNELFKLNNTKETFKNLLDAGIINENGELNFPDQQQQFII